MVFLAFSLQDQVEKYGAYVGIAAFFGLAVLTLLYFAQAREVKRLRAWAGRMPERAEDLEYAYEYAEEARRGPAVQPQPVAQPQPQPAARPVVQAQPVAVAPANGTVELKPEEVAALAFARAAGVHEPHLPKPHAAPVPVTAPAPVPAMATAAAPAPAQTVAVPPAPAPSANGGGTGQAPPPATPAARRADPLPVRRTPPPAPPRRGAASPPPRREGNARAMIITAIVAVFVLVAVGFAFTQLGGEDPTTNATPTATPGENEIGEDPTPEGGGTPAPTAEPGVSKEEAQIVVFNATAQTGLAATYQTNLVEDGYPDGNIEVGNLGEAGQATTSTVMYARGDKSAAEGVAEVLGIERVAQLDEATQAEAVKVGDREWNVVAIIGQDKSTG
ncbi:LytR C-terminal domain-containing protein [Solirubrobacter taibaiensis]|nr:LytR C-terminal domain-containing protein [Solirubrobacter taibaiensis]